MCPPSSSTVIPSDAVAFVSRGSSPSCVPGDTLSQTAYRHAAFHLHPDILAHSIRVFLLAKHLAEKEASSWGSGDRLPLLFTACILTWPLRLWCVKSETEPKPPPPMNFPSTQVSLPRLTMCLSLWVPDSLVKVSR